MLEILSQIVIYLIIATLIGGIVGYLIGRTSCISSRCQEAQPSNNHELHIDNQKAKEEERKREKELEPAPKVEDLGTAPSLLKEARDGGKDKLQRIKGVGPVLEKLLNDTGVYHFEQIANLTKSEAKWLDRTMSFPGRIEREKWIDQAKDFLIIDAK